MLKQFISLVIVASLVSSTMVFSAFAKGSHANQVGFIESIENLQKLNSYHSSGTLYGKFKVQVPFSDGGADGKFRFKFDDYTRNLKPYEANSSTLYSGRVTMRFNGDGRLLDELVVRLRGEMRMLANDGIYMKIDSFRFNVKGVPEKERAEFLAFKSEYEQKVNAVKGKWYYYPQDLLEHDVNTYYGLDDDLTDDEILKSFQKKGIKQTYADLITDTISSFGLSGDELRQLKTVVRDLMDAEFFTKRQIEKGVNKGITRFNFSKRRLINFLRKVADSFGETVSASDLKQLNEVLNKFYLSGMYRLDAARGIYDQFGLKLILKDIDMLKSMQINYFGKISGINQPVKVVKPARSINLETGEFPFFIPNLKNPNSEFNFEDELFDPSSDLFIEPVDHFPTELFPVEPIESDEQGVSVDDDPMLGSERAQVTVVEFSDYECPFCKRFHEETFPLIKEKYIDEGLVNYVYRDFPLEFHRNARLAANAAQCVYDQSHKNNVYFEYQDLLFENQHALNTENLKQWALEVGADVNKFAKCLEAMKFDVEIDRDIAEGKSYGVSGTPAFFVNGTPVRGAVPFSAFDAVIKEELEKVRD